MIAKVIVVCDNPRHTGKVAKVSTFYVEDGTVRLRDNGQRPRDRRNRRMKADPMHPGSLNFFFRGVADTPACNLCGRSLPDDPRVAKAVAFIAAQGGPSHTVALSDVAAIISKLEA